MFPEKFTGFSDQFKRVFQVGGYQGKYMRATDKVFFLEIGFFRQCYMFVDIAACLLVNITLRNCLVEFFFLLL